MPTEIRPLMDERAVSAITGRAVRTLQKDRIAGAGIPYIRIMRHIRYRPEDVETWLAARRTFNSTCEYESTPDPLRDKPRKPSASSRRRVEHMG
jgi:hypothetical protein